MRLIDADRLMGDFSCTFYNDLDDQNRTEKLINEAPTVERPHGEWDKDVRVINYLTRRCLECFKYSAVGNFCMWCGADMRQEEGEAE